jgi:hypothetical protein
MTAAQVWCLSRFVDEVNLPALSEERLAVLFEHCTRSCPPHAWRSGAWLDVPNDGVSAISADLKASYHGGLVIPGEDESRSREGRLQRRTHRIAQRELPCRS